MNIAMAQFAYQVSHSVVVSQSKLWDGENYSTQQGRMTLAQPELHAKLTKEERMTTYRHRLRTIKD